MNNPISPFEKWRLETIPQVGFTPEIRELLAMAFEGGRQSVADKQTKEALEMAISEIEGWIDHAYGHSPEDCADNKAIQACKEALAEAEKQEDYPSKEESLNKIFDAVYTQYPKKEWQSLRDDEINEYWYQSNNDVEGVRLGFTTQQHYFARAIEQALKDKNKF